MFRTPKFETEFAFDPSAREAPWFGTAIVQFEINTRLEKLLAEVKDLPGNLDFRIIAEVPDA